MSASTGATASNTGGVLYVTSVIAAYWIVSISMVSIMENEQTVSLTLVLII